MKRAALQLAAAKEALVVEVAGLPRLLLGPPSRARKLLCRLWLWRWTLVEQNPAPGEWRIWVSRKSDPKLQPVGRVLSYSFRVEIDPAIPFACGWNPRQEVARA